MPIVEGLGMTEAAGAICLGFCYLILLIKEGDPGNKNWRNLKLVPGIRDCAEFIEQSDTMRGKELVLVNCPSLCRIFGKSPGYSKCVFTARFIIHILILELQGDFLPEICTKMMTEA